VEIFIYCLLKKRHPFDFARLCISSIVNFAVFDNLPSPHIIFSKFFLLTLLFYHKNKEVFLSKRHLSSVKYKRLIINFRSEIFMETTQPKGQKITYFQDGILHSGIILTVSDEHYEVQQFDGNQGIVLVSESEVVRSTSRITRNTLDEMFGFGK
jgi:hypothetical protein